jgi:hypothetical protein
MRINSMQKYPVKVSDDEYSVSIDMLFDTDEYKRIIEVDDDMREQIFRIGRLMMVDALNKNGVVITEEDIDDFLKEKYPERYV